MMETASIWAQRGTCSRLRVGAVLADRDRILVQGYNGNVAGMQHCPDPHPEGPCETAVHAEENVLYFAANRGIPTQGTTIYVTHAPCYRCARGIVNAGVERVIYQNTYRTMDGVRLLREAGVTVNGIEWYGV
jgi:dCMP deaminase